jgi:hypothetical protein
MSVIAGLRLVLRLHFRLALNRGTTLSESNSRHHYGIHLRITWLRRIWLRRRLLVFWVPARFGVRRNLYPRGRTRTDALAAEKGFRLVGRRISADILRATATQTANSRDAPEPAVESGLDTRNARRASVKQTLRALARANGPARSAPASKISDSEPIRLE